MAVPQDSTVRWFHSEMSGAPQIEAVAGSLVAVLDACLINGFDSRTPDGAGVVVSGGIGTAHFSGGHDYDKHAVIEIAGASPSALNGSWRITEVTATALSFDCPEIPDGSATGSITVKRATPAYWEKPFGDSLKGAYRSSHPDATGFYFRIDDSAASNGSSLVRGYEVMTGIDDGEFAFPPPEDVPDYTWRKLTGTSGSRNWLLVADARTVYLCWVNNSTNVTVSGQCYMFGDIQPHLPNDDWGFGIRAHENANPTSSSVGLAPIASQIFASSSMTGCNIARRSNGDAVREMFQGVIANTPDSTTAPDMSEFGAYYYAQGQVPVWSRTGTEANSAVYPRGNLRGFVRPVMSYNSLPSTEFNVLFEGGGAAPPIIVRRAVASGINLVGFDIWGPWS